MSPNKTGWNAITDWHLVTPSNMEQWRGRKKGGGRREEGSQERVSKLLNSLSTGKGGARGGDESILTFFTFSLVKNC